MALCLGEPKGYLYLNPQFERAQVRSLPISSLDNFLLSNSGDVAAVSVWLEF